MSDGTGNATGFADGNTSGNDYAYDAAGSVSKDLNRGMSSIAYNLLKLPRQVSFTNGKSVSYQYDAAGNKLTSSAVGEQRTYVGVVQYLNGSLFEIAHEEGRYSLAGGYEWQHRDHLGNVRVSFTGAGGVANASQYRDYDPWGLELSGLSSGGSTNRARYNGKEALVELGGGLLDYEARLYDATIGRWGVVDPLADVARRWSPYAYGSANPIRFIDPDGRESRDVMYSDGYGSYSSRDATGAIELEGTYETGPGPKQAKAQTQGGLSTVNTPGTGIRKNGSGELDLYSTKPLITVPNDQFVDPLLATLDLLYNTNFSGGQNGQHPEYIGGGAPSFGVKGGYTTVYRSVSEAELDDIAKFGLRNKSGAYETGKLFAPTAEEATRYGRNNYFAFDQLPNTLIKVRVPYRVISEATRFGADGMNAIAIPSQYLPLLRVKPLNYNLLIK